MCYNNIDTSLQKTGTAKNGDRLLFLAKNGDRLLFLLSPLLHVKLIILHS